MFERFTQSARAVVVSAQDEARALGHEEISPDHLLLAILATDDPAADRLREAGLDHATLRRDLRRFGEADAAALATVGVDLDAVRERVEAVFGPDALERRTQRRSLLRRALFPSTHLPFTRAAKDVLEQSLREALALHHRHLGVEHIALGLVADGRAPAARTLTRLGVDPGRFRDRLLDNLRGAA
jgi:ATP-dependent Clp protease ATP-binding subunit ClpA